MSGPMNRRTKVILGAGASILAATILVGVLAPRNAPAPKAEAPAAESRWQPTAAQAREARLALCQAVAEEVGGHAPDPDAMSVAQRGTSAGAAAGRRAVAYEYEWAYKNGQWNESECTRLSTASWASDLYVGDPIHLRRGAIGAAIR